MNEPEPLELAAWRMAAGKLASEDLPDLATGALIRGSDSPSLRILAGQSRDDVRESADLFRAALDELGIDVPDTDQAHWNLARRTAAAIVEGQTSPGDGASELWSTYLRVRDNGDLRIFVGLTSQLDDHPEDVMELSAQITMEAQALLDRAEPRHWIKLMAVLGRCPLTRTAGSTDVEADLDALDISVELRADVLRWDRQFVNTLRGWPESGGFKSMPEAEAFVAEGERLVSRLQHELGPTYHVEYMPEPIRPPGVKLRHRRFF